MSYLRKYESDNIKIIDGEQWFRRQYVQHYGIMMGCFGALIGVFIGLVLLE